MKNKKIVISLCLIPFFLTGCDLSEEEIERREQEKWKAETMLIRERNKKAIKERKQQLTKIKEDYEKLEYIIGTIIDESNESGMYYLGIETEDGKIFGVHIIDSEDKKAEALNMIVKIGSKIGFPAGNLKSADSWPAQYYSEETCFNEETQIGTKRADRIKVF